MFRFYLPEIKDQSARCKMRIGSAANKNEWEIPLISVGIDQITYEVMLGIQSPRRNLQHYVVMKQLMKNQIGFYAAFIY